MGVGGLLSGCATSGNSSVATNAPKKEVHAYWGEATILNHVDVIPQPRFQPATSYPSGLRDHGVTGSAVISYVVDVNGNCKDVVVKTATNLEFGQAAGRTIAGMKYIPARTNGRAVECQMEFPIAFAASPAEAPFPVDEMPRDH